MSAEVRAGPPETFVNVESWSAMVDGLRCFFRGSMYLVLDTRGCMFSRQVCLLYIEAFASA